MAGHDLNELRVPSRLFGHEILGLHFFQSRMFEAAILTLKHSCLFLFDLAAHLFHHVIGVILFALFVHLQCVVRFELFAANVAL